MLLQLPDPGLRRKRFLIRNRSGSLIETCHRQMMNFCGNDYLCISTHPEVKQAFINGINEYGFGSGSSVLISGYYKPFLELEEKAAEFLNRERAVFFNSGYHANIGVLTTLCSRSRTVISDRLCHASILDGIVLSRAEHYRYRHNDINNVREISTKAAGALLVTESVFSMEGDIAPVDELALLVREYGAELMVDDAHGIGVLGQNGRGVLEHFGLDQHAVPYLVSPLGKAVGGIGAIVSGSSDFIEMLVQVARTYRYTTALPPAVACAAIAALKVLERETWRRERLCALVRYFVKQAALRDIPLIANDITPIKSILVSGNEMVVAAQQRLIEVGILVSCIRSPTVAKGSERIRISLNCMHTEKDIKRLLDYIEEFYAYKPMF